MRLLAKVLNSQVESLLHLEKELKKVRRLIDYISFFMFIKPRMKIYFTSVQFLLGFAFSFRGFRLPLIDIPTELGVFTGGGAEIPSNQIR